jgi:hypothetical protein
MNCPSCGHEFAAAELKQQRQKLISPVLKCPGCQNWLQQSATASYLKILALLAWVVGSFGVYGFSPETNKLISYSLFIGGFAVFVLSFKLTKLLLASEHSPS